MLGDAGEQYRKWTQELLAESDPAEVVAALLKHAYGKMLNKDSYRKLTPVMRKKATSDRFSSNMESKTRLYIAKGKADGLSRKTLAEFIVDQTGVAKQSIEDIEVFDGYSFVTVPFDKAERIITKLKSLKIGKNRLFVEKAKPAPQKRRK